MRLIEEYTLMLVLFLVLAIVAIGQIPRIAGAVTGFMTRSVPTVKPTL